MIMSDWCDFKVGDKVRRKVEHIDKYYKDTSGDTLTVCEVSPTYHGGGLRFEGGEGWTWDAIKYELVTDDIVQEEKVIDIHTDSWWVKIDNQKDYDDFVAYLRDNKYGEPIFDYSSNVRYVTNTTSDGKVHQNFPMWMGGRNEWDTVYHEYNEIKINRTVEILLPKKVDKELIDRQNALADLLIERKNVEEQISALEKEIANMKGDVVC